jgi:hypothetical protein
MTVETAQADAGIQAALDATKKAKVAKTPKAPKEPKVAKVAKMPRTPSTDYTLSPSATITYGSRDGKSFGPDNVPYRLDSKRASRFGLIISGMTVEDAGKAGLSGRRLKDMADAGVINISGVTPVVAESAAEMDVADEEAA